MYISLTNLSDNRASNADFDTNGRLYQGSNDLDWDNRAKIEEVIIVDKDNKDKEKDPWKKNRQLKRQK